ncbi:hypothetical protein, partial [Actinoplanes regularis]|uniref:hypothetical protein n=1 Tax=Actinoplanes regularis TaxID=52697 RepID=UPI00194112CB
MANDQSLLPDDVTPGDYGVGTWHPIRPNTRLGTAARRDLRSPTIPSARAALTGGITPDHAPQQVLAGAPADAG